ncbi:BON1-associated protein 2 [Nymphaea thermarum]|nr:BON1-associated protein 2 [Nymphaea thermarum]
MPVLVPLLPMEYAASLEVNVISAESLRFPTGTIGRNMFVVVGTDSCDRRATAVDQHGGAYPSWNEKLTVPFPPQVRSIEVDVRCKTARGEKSVCRSTIAVSDFIGGYDIPCGYLHFLSYRLHDKEGKRNGIINLAVKVLCLRPSAPLFPVPAAGLKHLESYKHGSPSRNDDTNRRLSGR